jgi:hypothetical protein
MTGTRAVRTAATAPAGRRLVARRLTRGVRAERSLPTITDVDYVRPCRIPPVGGFPKDDVRNNETDLAESGRFHSAQIGTGPERLVTCQDVRVDYDMQQSRT